MWFYLIGSLVLFMVVSLWGEEHSAIEKFIKHQRGSFLFCGVMHILIIIVSMFHFVFHPFGDITEKRSYTMTQNDALVVHAQIRSEGRFMGVKVRGYGTNAIDTVFENVLSEQRKQEAESYYDAGLEQVGPYTLEHPNLGFWYGIYVSSLAIWMMSLIFILRGAFFLKEVQADPKLDFLEHHVCHSNFVMKNSFLFNPWKSINIEILNTSQTKKINCKLLKKQRKIFSLQYISNITKRIKRK
jgi:hypothetical protein